ncbi:hypothetical protein LCGC14_1247230 [marine sediment metagenome]|uniref:Uncharacterized protein n=1 Tax=marine sediment metagenome TaxID=412755 RepID=A0A0F9P829_9ZZZZ
MQPPTLDQLEAYIKLRNLSVNPRKFLMHYEDSEPPWTNNGKPVKNWKLTAQSWHYNNMSRADTHICSMCKNYGVYVYKDATGQAYWRCVDHKLKHKTFVSKETADKALPKTIKLHKVNKNNERNRQLNALKEK